VVSATVQSHLPLPCSRAQSHGATGRGSAHRPRLISCASPPIEAYTRAGLKERNGQRTRPFAEDLHSIAGTLSPAGKLHLRTLGGYGDYGLESDYFFGRYFRISMMSPTITPQ
jgi:hypothetical protein